MKTSIDATDRHSGQETGQNKRDSLQGGHDNLRPRRFFGLHFDLHANDKDRELGAQVNDELVERIIREAKPDFIQYDCKGHCGWLAYPDSKVSATAGGPNGEGIINDSLAVYRRVTAKNNVGLYMHFSGVWDDVALHDHPEWATLDELGNRRKNATSTFSPYVRERMIPQILEIIERYQVDGFWVDGDCWAVWPDYCDEAKRRFRERTGIETPPVKPGDPGWLEWTSLHREQFMAYVRTYCEAAREAAPDIKMISNWFHSRQCPMSAKDTPVDFISGDFSMYNSVDTGRIEARQMAAVGMPWDLMAWGKISIPNVGRVQKSAVQVCQEAAQVLAQGGGFQAYYSPDRDGGIADCQFTLMREIGDFCRAREASCYQTETVPQVGVLLDTVSMWSGSPAVANFFFGGEYQGMQGVLQACIEAGHSIDIVMDHQLAEKAAQYPVLVIPEWAEPAAETVAILRDYVNNGGALLLTGAATARRFADMTGVDFVGEPTQTAATLHLPGTVFSGGCDGLWQSVIPHSGTRVVATRTVKQHQDRSPVPAATVAAFGKGKVATVFGPLGQVNFAAHPPHLRELVATLLDALYQPLACMVPGNYGKVDMVLRQRDGRRFIHLLNVNNMCTSGGDIAADGNAVISSGNYPFTDQIPEVGPVTVTLRGSSLPDHVTLVLEGRQLPVEKSDGQGIVTVPRLHIHSVIEIGS
jgi:hypothetical protein